MRSLLAAAALVALALSTTGCAGIAFNGRVGYAAIYAENKMPETATSNSPGPKTGEACAQSVLGWVTTGDATIPTAARNGGIRRIATVDNKHTNILGVYSTYCVVVTGE